MIDKATLCTLTEAEEQLTRCFCPNCGFDAATVTPATEAPREELNLERGGSMPEHKTEQGSLFLGITIGMLFGLILTIAMRNPRW